MARTSARADGICERAPSARERRLIVTGMDMGFSEYTIFTGDADVINCIYGLYVKIGSEPAFATRRPRANSASGQKVPYCAARSATTFVAAFGPGRIPVSGTPIGPTGMYTVV